MACCRHQPLPVVLQRQSDPGANSSSYTIPSVQLSDAGTYWVVVSNRLNTVTSSNASLVSSLNQHTARLQLERAANGRTSSTAGRASWKRRHGGRPVAHSPNGFSPYTTPASPPPVLSSESGRDATTMRKKSCVVTKVGSAARRRRRRWTHWSRSSSTIASNTLTFDMWPDMTNTPTSTRPDLLTQRHISHAVQFSDQQTVDRHFDWMLEHGIDACLRAVFVG